MSLRRLIVAVVGASISNSPDGRERFAIRAHLPALKALPDLYEAVAVTSLQPSALYPGVPTLAGSGLPGYESGSAYGVYGPAKMPVTIVKRLNQEIVRFLNAPETQERFLGAGVEATGGTPERFVAEVKADMARWGKVIKDAGIRAD